MTDRELYDIECRKTAALTRCMREVAEELRRLDGVYVTDDEVRSMAKQLEAARAANYSPEPKESAEPTKCECYDHSLCRNYQAALAKERDEARAEANYLGARLAAHMSECTSRSKAERDELRAEVERLKEELAVHERGMAGELEEFKLGDFESELRVRAPQIVSNMTAALDRWFAEREAENNLECMVVYEVGRSYVVTAQKVGAKTPAEQRDAARAEVSQLRSAITELHANWRTVAYEHASDDDNDARLVRRNEHLLKVCGVKP